TPSTTNSANEPAPSGTPRAENCDSTSRRAEVTMVCSTSRTDRCAVTASTAELTACSSVRSPSQASAIRQRYPPIAAARIRSRSWAYARTPGRVRCPRAGRCPVPSVDAMPIAIITGASRGLGYALAAGLAGTGWRLVVDGRDPDALAAAGQRLTALTTVTALTT